MANTIECRIRRRARFAALVAVMVFAAGCGDEDDTSTRSRVSFPNDDGSRGIFGNSELDIGGTPPSKIYNGLPFEFTPEISNPENTELTFSASNLPGWATIDRETGRLSGTPGRADIGSYANIRIMVSGGGTLVTSAPFSIEVVSNAIGTAKLTWLPPVQNTNGRPLTNLAGFKIYWGTSPSNLNLSKTINDSNLTSYTVEELAPATWYFATSAFNASGVEGPLTGVVSKRVELEAL